MRTVRVILCWLVMGPFYVIGLIMAMLGAAAEAVFEVVSPVVNSFIEGPQPADDGRVVTARQAEELIARHGYWGEHPRFKISDWQFEVGNNDTRQGYWEWVVGSIEKDKEITA